MREWFQYDYWSPHEAHLLLANVFPHGAEIVDGERVSPRYGIVESPVVVAGGLLDWDCNVRFHDRYERLLIGAGKRLRLIRAHWARGNHTELCYPPKYFVAWAMVKNIKPCWLDLWENRDAPPAPKATGESRDAASCTVVPPPDVDAAREPDDEPAPPVANAPPADGGLSKREKQIRAIETEANGLKYPRLRVPKGGKKAIQVRCKAHYADLFGVGDDPFLDAWKYAVAAGRIRMADHDAYSGK
ncbi:hypothetical protein [Caballeronia sp. dw_19]|uniref:hypothetical protein n=1 Tax=Caballeronia sp. dw_19 TaxID=2719791 RepID=UPI001BD303EA|nr:hypothetical protein [Caballeronia sp. dw_19]